MPVEMVSGIDVVDGKSSSDLIRSMIAVMGLSRPPVLAHGRRAAVGARCRDAPIVVHHATTSRARHVVTFHIRDLRGRAAVRVLRRRRHGAIRSRHSHAAKADFLHDHAAFKIKSALIHHIQYHVLSCVTPEPTIRAPNWVEVHTIELPLVFLIVTESY